MTHAEVCKDFSSKYAYIKKNVIEFTNTLAKSEQYVKLLEDLKNLYGREIRSRRQLDAVKDVESLMKLMEKRLMLGWFDVEPLVTIMKYFEGEKTNTFQELMDYRTKFNKFSLKNKEAFSPPPYDPDIFNDVPASREVIPAELMMKIGREIGSDWIKFGRELIPEGLITEGFLDKMKSNTELSSEGKMLKLLEIFVDGDKRSKRSHLSKLFKKINRNDLDAELLMALQSSTS